MLLDQPHLRPLIPENVPFLPVPHILPQHLAGIAGQLSYILPEALKDIKIY